MKTMQEVIHEVIEEMDPNASAEEKRQNEAILAKIVDEKVPPLEAVHFTPDMLEVLYSNGYHLYTGGKYDEAQLLFSFLILLDRRNPKFHLALAACKHMQKKYLEAVEEYMLASYWNITDDPMPYYHIADCYLKLNHPEHAVIALEISIGKAGDNPKFAKIKSRAQLTQSQLIKDLEEKHERSKQLQK